ncbi:hypothetical protein AB0H76_33695 [Nocardia sp. NPDC050712]|uniref:hypothetical protein n=1 Tax=Nocardia sp. NPDC050712 TaxID=3155518 RepID=UPI0033DF5BA1
MKLRAFGAVAAALGLVVALSGTAHADHEMVVLAAKAGEAPSAICETAGLKQALVAQDTAEPVALLQKEKVASAFVGSAGEVKADLVLRDNGMVTPYVQQINDTDHALCTKADAVTPAKTDN